MPERPRRGAMHMQRADATLRLGKDRGFEESFRRVFTDQALYAKMFLATPVYVADRVWDKYRLHPESCVAVAARSGTLQHERRRYLDFVASCVMEHGLTHTAVWRAVQFERWRERHQRLVAAGSMIRRMGSGIIMRTKAAVPERARLRLRRLLREVLGTSR